MMKTTKREFLRAGLAASATTILGGAELGAQGRGEAPGKVKKIPPIVSPTFAKWTEAMPVPAVAVPVSSGTGCESALTGPAFSTSGRQRLAEFPPVEAYELDVEKRPHIFHQSQGGTDPTLSAEIFGYGGTYPGPTFKARYGTPLVVRYRNLLPAAHTGFGTPQFTIHLHNLHHASESDGFPLDYVLPGEVRDNHYVMYPAGGDEREKLGTMWYHDHRLDFTSQNVYRGLFGFFLAFDDLDTGNETDVAPALGLPSGDFDVPMAFTDPQFDSTQGGALYFNQLDTDGHLGDTYAVNGKLFPVFEVQRRKYRFRFLAGGPSRFYQMFMRNYGAGGAGTQADVPLTLISNDGNLLSAPMSVPSVRMGPANRFDVIVDFTNYADGTVLFLENRLEQLNGRGPTGTVLGAGAGQLLKIVVRGSSPAADPSRVPTTLRPAVVPPATIPANVVRRTFQFSRGNGQWLINGEVAGDMSTPRFTTNGSAPEIWTLQNGGNWWHPIHIHFEEGVIISRNGAPPPAIERNARKDVYLLSPGETIEVYFQGFRDFKGRYPMHCHNLVHEDHAMMLRFDII